MGHWKRSPARRRARQRWQKVWPHGSANGMCSSLHGGGGIEIKIAAGESESKLYYPPGCALCVIPSAGPEGIVTWWVIISAVNVTRKSISLQNFWSVPRATLGLIQRDGLGGEWGAAPVGLEADGADDVHLHGEVQHEMLCVPLGLPLAGQHERARPKAPPGGGGAAFPLVPNRRVSSMPPSWRSVRGCNCRWQLSRPNLFQTSGIGGQEGLCRDVVDGVVDACRGHGGDGGAAARRRGAPHLLDGGRSTTTGLPPTPAGTGEG